MIRIIASMDLWISPQCPYAPKRFRAYTDGVFVYIHCTHCLCQLYSMFVHTVLTPYLSVLPLPIVTGRASMDNADYTDGLHGAGVEQANDFHSIVQNNIMLI